MPGQIKTRRWCDPKEADDGIRILTCRYRPRALTKKDETWMLWRPELGPSKELHAAVYGKGQEPLAWEEFTARYNEEMKEQSEEIDVLAEMVQEGKTITLLCSKACETETRCHRSLLKRLIEERMAGRLAAV